MPEVPRQRRAAATARTGLQPGYLPALHRTARGDDRLVIDQPAIEADQDRRPCRASRPRHHLPAGRGGHHRSDGPRHPRVHPPIARASVMCMTAIHVQSERKQHDRSVRCAEKHRFRARTQWFRGVICTVSAACATAGAA